MIRKNTKNIKVKNLMIGGGNPISVQSMTNLPLKEVSKTIDQVNRLEEAGADLVRVAIRTEDEIKYLDEILKNVNLPICGDIHFNYKIALGAIKKGISKIRLNPGNIGDQKNISEVVKAASSFNVPIRIGVNGGSVDRKKYPEVTPEALVDSAMDHVQILENLNFDQIIISIKSSNIFQTIEANRMLSQKRDYPIHIGLTEAGYGLACTVQSSIVIGHLLLNGIGDTIRVSMTGDPIDEIKVGKEILKSLGEIKFGIKLISCPTCGRTDTEINLLDIATLIEAKMNNRYLSFLSKENKKLTVAVMGCEVNGPGEAAEADIGIAGIRKGEFMLFSKGIKVKKVNRENLLDSVFEVTDELLNY